MTEIIGITPPAPKPDTSEPGYQREMYPSAEGLRQTFEAQRDALHDAGLTPAELTTRERTLADAMATSGLDAYSVGPVLAEHEAAAILAEARGEPDVDEAQLQQWREEVRRALREQYGASEVEPLLTRAQKFVAAQKPLAAVLQRRAIGARPDVVHAIVDHVRRVNFR